jgi:uncharacterized protein
MRIIDMHAHIWNDGYLTEKDTSINEPEKNLSDILKISDNWPELDKVGIMPLYGGEYPGEKDIIEGNNDTERFTQTYPEQLFGYFTINPCLTANALSEIKRAAETKHIYAIKSWIACRADRDEMVTIVKACIDYDLPILIHAFYKKPSPLPEESTPDHIAELAKKLPRAKIIMAHIGMDWAHGARAIADYENIYTDFSGSLMEQGSIEKAVRYLGVERILFGSDLPYASFAANVGMLKGADLSTDQKNKIASANAVKLLKLPAMEYVMSGP